MSHSMLETDFVRITPDDPATLVSALSEKLEMEADPFKKRILRILIETMPQLAASIAKERNQGIRTDEVPDLTISIALTLLDTMLDLLVDNDTRRRRLLLTMTAATLMREATDLTKPRPDAH